MHHFIKFASSLCTLQILIKTTYETQLLAQVTCRTVYIQRGVVGNNVLLVLQSE